MSPVKEIKEKIDRLEEKRNEILEEALQELSNTNIPVNIKKSKEITKTVNGIDREIKKLEELLRK